MKNAALTLLLCLAYAIGHAQLVPIKADASGHALIDTVIEVAGEKGALFFAAKEWVYRTYKSGDAVIDTDDKEVGKIACKGRTQSLVYDQVIVKNDGGHFAYNFSIQVKDGKVRYRVFDITYQKGEMIGLNTGSDFGESYPSTWPKMGKKNYQKRWDDFKKETHIELSAIFITLVDALKKANADDKW